MISRRIFILWLLLLLWAMPATAAALKMHVAEFTVTGATEKEGLKQALQSMLASRLSGEGTVLVNRNEDPDMTVVGTYIVFGKVFSLDGQIVSREGKVLGRAFEQGDSADEVIPAVGRLAEKLNKEIARINPVVPFPAPAAPSAVKAAVAAQVSREAARPDIITPSSEDVTKKGAEIVRPEASGSSRVIDQKPLRLDGVLVGAVLGKTGAQGKRLLAAALAGEIRLYGMDDGLELLHSDKDFGGSEKIVAIDGADLDGNGADEFYVTCFRGDDLASRVYEIENGRLKMIAGKLPYFFRAIARDGGVRMIYAQQMSSSEDFYGDIYELVRNGSSYDIANPVKLPRFANIYNVNIFRGGDGRKLFVSLHPDGNLTIYSENGENLWKSSDKFGGSEQYFSRDDSQNMRFTGSQQRKVFLEQRITITKDGGILVPRHEGGFAIGASRTYAKSSIYAFKWDGAVLDEIWHTRQSQNYLADYMYDEERQELLLIEIVKREGLFEKGSSLLSIRKIE